MKKIRTLLAIGALTTVVVGCTPRQQDVQIDKISSLAGILSETVEISQQFQRGEITLEQFNALSLELEDKYERLTQNTVENANEELETMENDLNKQFATIHKTIVEAQDMCKLPERAERLGLSEPQGLTIQKKACKQTFVGTEGYDSVTLVYDGSYETAMQQAKIIAEKAKVPVSAEFKMAQDTLSGLSTEEVAQITSGSMLKGIVYTNYGLLATDIEYLITIAVDENGKLTIEVTNYSQMKK